jgi:hypothetical protein
MSEKLESKILSQLSPEESAALIAKLQQQVADYRIESQKLRASVLHLAGAVNLDEEWLKPNEPTVTILMACTRHFQEAMHLITQGVRRFR